MQMVISMTAIGRTTRPMGTESTLTQMEPSTRAIGSMISSTGKAWKNGPTALSMKVLTSSVRKTATENSFGPTCPPTRATFLITTSTVLESTGGPTAECTKEIGCATKCTAAETSAGRMVVSTQATTTTTRNKVMVYLHGPTGASIMEHGLTESKKVLEYTRMPTMSSSLASGRMERGSNGSPRRSTRTMRGKQITINEDQQNKNDDHKSILSCR